MSLKIVTSVSPYVTVANAFESLILAHQDGFAGVELNEDHLHVLADKKPNCLELIRNYSSDKRMINSLHRSLHYPSLDSTHQKERRYAVEYTLKTIDYMEKANIQRLVLHSFSDLPSFFRLRSLTANKVGYIVGCHVVKIYGVLAPVLKAYRTTRKEKYQNNFVQSLSLLARHAQDKRLLNGEPIEIVVEEHYSDAIDYKAIPYGKGKFSNVLYGVDTAHHLIRTGRNLNMDYEDLDHKIHFHAVDTNGFIDDHRTVGTGKVDFSKSLSAVVKKNIVQSLVIEDGSRKSALESLRSLNSMISKVM